LAKTRGTNRKNDPVVDALKDLLIVQLALARVPGHTIRKVARCDMARVTQLTRHLKGRMRRDGAEE
jgi:hypothetical protein